MRMGGEQRGETWQTHHNTENMASSARSDNHKQSPQEGSHSQTSNATHGKIKETKSNRQAGLHTSVWPHTPFRSNEGEIKCGQPVRERKIGNP